MCFHLFGGVSSPNYSNFALRKSVADDAANLGKAVAKSILKNFCVDDLLKSVEDEVYDASLIRRIQ